MELQKSRDMMYKALSHHRNDTDGLYAPETYENTMNYICTLIEDSTSAGYTYCMPKIFFLDWALERRIYIELIQKGYNVCRGLAGDLFFISWEDTDKYAHISDTILEEAGVKEVKSK